MYIRYGFPISSPMRYLVLKGGLFEGLKLPGYKQPKMKFKKYHLEYCQRTKIKNSFNERLAYCYCLCRKMQKPTEKN